MNTEDSFERKLQRQPLRRVPPAWREEILTAARRVTIETPAQVRAGSDPSFFAASRSLLANFLWPHPTAWAGLAAAWLLILGLNLAARDPSPSEVARQATAPSPEMRELLRQQEQLFAELIGPVEKSEAIEPKRRPPQPRSQLRAEFLNA